MDISCLTYKIRKWTRTPRNWTKKPVLGTTAFLVGWLYHGWMVLVWRTSRVRLSGLDEIEQALVSQRGAVVALFHETVLLAPYVVRALKPITIVNRSESGTLIAGILRRMGFQVIRGGSSRGTSRHKEVLKDLAVSLNRQREIPVFIAVDGSHGPVRVVKPGVVALARRANAPLFLCFAASTPSLRFPSWDGTRFPVPFSRVIIRFHGPIEPREDGKRVAAETLQHCVQDGLEKLSQEVLSELSAKP